MDVYWLEQSEVNLPPDDHWLTTAEKSRLASMRFAKRRADWRLGRWTAKQALASWLKLSCELHALADIEIGSALSGAPEVSLCGQATPAAISLSHRNGTAMCAVVPRGVDVGCDLETIEPRSSTFLDDYLTVGERTIVEHAVAEDRPLLVALFWSGKESALKAMGVGLRLDTRCLEVALDDDLPPTSENCDRDRPRSLPSPGPSIWSPVRVLSSEPQLFRGWWNSAGPMVRTIVSTTPLRPPIRLQIIC